MRSVCPPTRPSRKASPIWSGSRRYGLPPNEAEPPIDADVRLVAEYRQCDHRQRRAVGPIPDYLTKVITGVKFKDGVEVTKTDLVAA